MKKILAVLSLCLLSACVSNQGQYTVLSNKIVNVQDFELEKTDRTKHVKGIDRSHVIIFWNTKENPNISDALNDAFKKADGDVMTDVTVKTFSWWFLIYGQNGWTVEGDVVKTRSK